MKLFLLNDNCSLTWLKYLMLCLALVYPHFWRLKTSDDDTKDLHAVLLSFWRTLESIIQSSLSHHLSVFSAGLELCVWSVKPLNIVGAYTMTLNRQLVTFPVFCRVSDILRVLCSESHFFQYRLTYRGDFFGLDSWCWCWETAKTPANQPWNYFWSMPTWQPMWSSYLIITDKRTDRQLAVA